METQEITDQILNNNDKVAATAPEAPDETDPELQVKPKSSCRHCHGRGYIGTDVKTNKKVICACVRRSFDRVNKLKKERDRQIKDAQVSTSKGW